ncbi:MAG: MobC family plasmid mobilization relaxosome protein [Brevundimonas sp.]|uniref:plasmid mobilization protein n=1 Tax=Brevundimonas sp. TaxID=1871086 RepID=UPI00258295A8|nr:plasmid mobilization relaxosome protein MobC [Brevundimonas sp.]MCV0416598.1 MobC family plasmid mobilization relaxosome protein [Brevundimonas sp.]
MADDEQPPPREPSPGTRRKSDKRQRTEVLFARVTPEEKSAFAARADRAGMAAAAFMRALALGDAGPRARRQPPVNHVALRQVIADLGRIGNNVNQLARGMNIGEVPEVPELREAATALIDARNAIYEALGKEPAGDYQGKEPGRP